MAGTPGRNRRDEMYRSNPEEIALLKEDITRAMLIGKWCTTTLIELATHHNVAIDLASLCAKDCISIVRHIRSGDHTAPEYADQIQNIREDCDLKLENIYSNNISSDNPKAQSVALQAIEAKARLWGLYHEDKEREGLSPLHSAHVIQVFNQLSPDQIKELATSGNVTGYLPSTSEDVEIISLTEAKVTA